jgi:hypothetical protein
LIFKKPGKTSKALFVLKNGNLLFANRSKKRQTLFLNINNISDGVGNPKIFNLLKQVPDPEIPVISIVDLGIIRYVELVDGTAV